jgi:hypothetical protein
MTICFDCYNGDCNEHGELARKLSYKLIETSKPKPEQAPATIPVLVRPALLAKPTKRIESYLFSLNPNNGLTFGTACTWIAARNPAVVCRPKRLFVNVTCPGLVYISSILVANIDVQLCPNGEADGYTFSRGRDEQAPFFKLDLPVCPPQNCISVRGRWTGYVPIGCACGSPFTLALDFEVEVDTS